MFPLSLVCENMIRLAAPKIGVHTYSSLYYKCSETEQSEVGLFTLSFSHFTDQNNIIYQSVLHYLFGKAERSPAPTKTCLFDYKVNIGRAGL